MSENQFPIASFYRGWDEYQRLLVAAIAPLSAEQLALQTAPHLWSVEMLAKHIISARVGWFHVWMGEGSAELAPLCDWDEADQPARSAAELVSELEQTWQLIQNALAQWTTSDLEYIFESPYPDQTRNGKKRTKSRQWIIWHVLEHDLHHGGELSLILGSHGIAAIDL